MSLTPAQQQYQDIKKQYKDCIVFFRLGDFYETFYEDAKITSKACDIVLTARQKDSPNPIPMAGIPYHSADKYIQKLIHAGYKVALAEQVSEPKPGQIVQRQVTHVITPGTYLQDTQQKTFNYLVSIVYQPDNQWYHYHLAWGDFSLWQYLTSSFTTLEETVKAVGMLYPSEVILAHDLPNKDLITQYIHNFHTCLISSREDMSASNFLHQLLKVQTLEGYGKALESWRKTAVSLLMSYLKHTQQTDQLMISGLRFLGERACMMIDPITIKNLELLESHYDANKKRSLIGAIDQTKTLMGAKLMRNWLLNPLMDIEAINHRLNLITWYVNHQQTRNVLLKSLGSLVDIPKLLALIIYRKPLPTLFVKLFQLLQDFLHTDGVREELKRCGLGDDYFEKVQKILVKIWNTLDIDAINDEVNFVREGIDQEIDVLKTLAFHSDELLLEYQKHLVEKTWVTNVKLKYVSNQWYFLAVTPKDISSFESYAIRGDERYDFIRRQTLKWEERYSTPYLEWLERKIFAAKQQLMIKEYHIVQQLKHDLELAHQDFLMVCEAIATLDVVASYGALSDYHSYVRPLVQLKWELTIIGGRHPVIESVLDAQEHFIPNDLQIGSQESLMHIITWPNMGGKSTYLRQNALIILLAHAGFWVPAKSAEMPLTDALFARIGSGDVIAKKQSTFMTEMIEMSNILHNATSRSFIVLDELGRGTSTYDGLALARSIVEFIAKNTKAKTLFATHYHELISCEWVVPGVKNFSVSVYETDKEVVFLKKIVAGGASKSYGLDVAGLAGIPKSIIEHARRLLKELETTKKDWPVFQNLFSSELLTFHEEKSKYDKLKILLDSIDVNTITPLQALQLLAKVKDES